MEKTKNVYCSNWRYIRKELYGDPENNFIDKKKIYNTISDYMMLRLSKMFEWKGLPDTIPSNDLEAYLLAGGISVIAKSEGMGIWKKGLYAFDNSAGDNLSPYHRPTFATIANVALNMNKVVYDNVDAVFIYNDNYGIGAYPLLDLFANYLTDAYVTLGYGLVNARIPAVGVAKNDNDKQALKEMFDGIFDGSKWAIAVSKSTTLDLKGTETFPFSENNSDGIKASLEAIQYLKASMFNEFGLNSNFNMKREALNSAESALNKASLLPLCDQMLEMRRQGAEKMNRLFGTRVSVNYSSSWKDEAEERKESEDGGNGTGDGKDDAKSDV